MDIKETILARKYAQAFINIFGDKLDLNDLEKLEKVISFFKSHHDAVFYLSLPTLSDQVKQEQLEKIIEELKLPYKAFSKLIKLLIEDTRIFIFPKVVFFIRELLKQKLNILEFKVKTSHKLSENFINSIIEFLSSKVNKKILYNTNIDKSLIAGIKAYSDNYLWEYSIERQLRNLKSLSKN